MCHKPTSFWSPPCTSSSGTLFVVLAVFPFLWHIFLPIQASPLLQPIAGAMKQHPCVFRLFGLRDGTQTHRFGWVRFSSGESGEPFLSSFEPDGDFFYFLEFVTTVTKKHRSKELCHPLAVTAAAGPTAAAAAAAPGASGRLMEVLDWTPTAPAPAAPPTRQPPPVADDFDLFSMDAAQPTPRTAAFGGEGGGSGTIRIRRPVQRHRKSTAAMPFKVFHRGRRGRRSVQLLLQVSRSHATPQCSKLRPDV